MGVGVGVGGMDTHLPLWSIMKPLGQDGVVIGLGLVVGGVVTGVVEFKVVVFSG